MCTCDDTPIHLANYVFMCTLSIVSSPEHIAASAIKKLRVGAFLSEVPNTHIAQETGMSRQTVGKKLKSKDMSLVDFIALAQATAQNPVRLLGDAENKAEKKSPQVPAVGDETERR